MKRIWIIGLFFLGLEGLLFFKTYSATTSTPATTSSLQASALSPSHESEAQNAPSQSANALVYNIYPLAQADVHTLKISAQGLSRLTVAVASGVATLQNFAEQYGAIAVLNGGFFDPQNQKTTSYVTMQGQLAADPTQNDRLIHNPEIAPYMEKILNRSEFRQYRCGETIRYDITLHADPVPSDCQLVNAMGAGPRLLPDLTLEQEGFLVLDRGTVIRDSLSYQRPNARTAIGLFPNGDLLWVMVEQKPDAPDTSGLSLPALADFLKSMGVTKAMNLDGGGSSSLYFNDQTIYGDIDASGNPVERPVHSVLLIQALDQ